MKKIRHYQAIPLIVASIMSKKLAENLDALVLDVKTGSGAFMKNFEDSKRLAEALVKTGKSCGVKTEAVISDMNQPLGKYVGHALEVYECLKIMRGEADELMRETLDLSVEITARMLVLTGIEKTVEAAKLKAQEALNSGRALEKFRHNIQLQNGNSEICDSPDILLDKNLIAIPITAPKNGFLAEINTFAIGESLIAIGGGRTKVEDRIDYAVGYQCIRKIGDKIEKDEALGVLFCRREDQAAAITGRLRAAYHIGEEKTISPKLIREVFV